MPIAQLDRTVLHLAGDGVEAWLDGLITNSLSQNKSALTFAALLTPQGKIIADFFIAQTDRGLLLDTPSKFSEDLFKRLKMYRLRAEIDIEMTDLRVFAMWDGTGLEGYADPRDNRLGRRIISEALEATATTPENYDQHRLSLGVPDSMWDFEGSSTFPANANMDRLNGVDFKKGCFVGQEVVSRMYRKTEIRKRMCGFTFEGSLDEDSIKSGERVIGDVLHTHGSRGMAMVRLDRLKDRSEPPKVGSTDIRIMEPSFDIRRNDMSILPQFAALNAAWIEDLHVLEDSDKKMIAHPEIYTQDGNSVFSLHIGDEVAGVCALKKDTDGEWELTKMAVDPKFQGRGIGQILMETVEAYAKEILGRTRIYLLSNTKNAAAIRLYERNGWDIMFINEPHPTYARCNIGMEKYF